MSDLHNHGPQTVDPLKTVVGATGAIVVILGATGAVGEIMRQVLIEHDFPLRSIKFLASERSVGKSINFKGKLYAIEPIRPEAFVGVDIVLSSTPASVSRETRSEERRVGKECRSRWSPYH